MRQSWEATGPRETVADSQRKRVGRAFATFPRPLIISFSIVLYPSDRIKECLGGPPLESYVPATFVFLFIAFFQLSGGTNYVPKEGSRQAESAKERAVEATRTAMVMPKKAETVAVTSSKSAAPEAVVSRASINLSELPTAPRKAQALTPVTLEDLKPKSAMKVTLLTSPIPASPAQALAGPREETATATSDKDLRTILKSRVNMRMGPGTNFNVVSKLDIGAEVELLQEPGNGWMKLRVVETGRVGWMADYLVSAAAE